MRNPIGPRRSHLRRKIVGLILAYGLLLWAVGSGVGAEAAESVLVLHSYHADLPWTRGLEQGIREGLAHRPGMVLHVEFLDQIRYPPHTIFPVMETLLRAKFDGHPPDVILCTDDPAVDFLLERRERLFPDVPLVFCGINRYPSKRLTRTPALTGVVERLDLRETLKIALRLQPDTRRVAVVSDASRISSYRRAALRAVTGEFPTLEFHYLTNQSLELLLAEVRTLPHPGTILLYLLFVEELSGPVHPSGIAVLRQIAGVANVPIYTYKQTDVGHGALGGMVLSEVKMARLASEMVSFILDGTPVDQIPVVTQTPSAPVFDDRELRRFGLDADRLPPGAELRHRPGGFYHRHKGLVWTTVALFGVLLTLVAVLLLSIRRREKTAAALRRGREELEERVRERTRELDRTNRELRREIAERRETEAALTENEIKFRSIFHLSPQPVALAEPETGRILDANDQLCRLTGYRREELVGRSSVEIGLLHQDQRNRFFQELSQTGQVEGMEMTFHVRDGSTRDLLMFSRIITLVEHPTILTILVDVTRRNLLEQRLQRHRRMEAVATLAGGIAHQFNNAVYGIIGNVDLLRLKYPEDPVLNRHLLVMKEVSDRMSRLTNQLLAYARGGTFNLEVIRAGEILADTLAILKHEVPETVRMETRPAPAGTFLEVDIPQFQMAISAVITNALEAMATGGGALRIDAKPVRVDADLAPEAVPGDYLRITVSDTGRGMSPEIRTRMFEPFFTTHFQGRGLGMAAVYGILRSHGGWITVDSTEGRGTRVELYFPRVPAPAVSVPQRSDPPTGGTILVVEDDPAVMAVTEEMLAHLGYRVLKSETGGGAVDQIKEVAGEVDLVLLDIVLPDMTGREVFQRLRADWPELKVLLASGYAEDGPARAILNNGADGFIQKPYALSTLTRKLTEVMAA